MNILIRATAFHGILVASQALYLSITNLTSASLFTRLIYLEKFFYVHNGVVK